VRGFIDPNLREKAVFSNLRLTKIVALYELLEVLLFPFFDQVMRPDYKEMSSDVERTLTQQFT
jgi:hypothetical protein